MEFQKTRSFKYGKTVGLIYLILALLGLVGFFASDLINEIINAQYYYTLAFIIPILAVLAVFPVVFLALIGYILCIWELFKKEVAFNKPDSPKAVFEYFLFAITFLIAPAFHTLFMSYIIFIAQ